MDLLPSNIDPGFLSSPEISGVGFYPPNCCNQLFSFSTANESQMHDSMTTKDSPFMRSTQVAINSDSFTCSVCVGCGNPINDPYILRVAPNMEWHARCLKCCVCGQLLDEKSTCFVKNGKTYCKRDYTRLFGAKCGRCGFGFSKNDLVMRAKDRIFHVNCFNCTICHRQLYPGDEFVLNNEELFCKDHDAMMPADIIRGNQDLHIRGFSPSEIPSGSVASPSSLNQIHNPSGMQRNGATNPKRKDSKTTRVRTVLNEKQLHTLRTCYAANCRPDALMKEQLTEMTGLSARVIRVWFQNKRCKDKKRSIALKHQQEQQAKQQQLNKQNGIGNTTNLSCIDGVPMIASEPVRNDVGTPKPIEVQNYQQPAWKALSDFALQNDFDQLPFQQLINPYSDQGQSSLSDSSEVCSIASVSSASVELSTACSTPLSSEANVSINS